MNAKRWIAIFLAIVLILSLIGSILPTVFAAESYTIGLRDSGKNNKITAEAGSTVEAYLYLSGNPGIISAGVLVDCPAGVKLTKTESALSGHNFKPVWQYSQSYDVDPYLIWMIAPTGNSAKGLVTYNGNWCKLTFSLTEDIAVGEYTVSLTAPKDKNITAQTVGGVIKPNTNTYITGVTVSNLTISVVPPKCKHSWDSWTDKIPADCVNAGVQTRECSLCREQQERAVDPTGHKMGSWIPVTAPTCTKVGSEKQVCQNKNCGHNQWRNVAKINHLFSEFTVEKEATCQKNGEKVSVCALCNQKKTERIEKLEHRFADFVVEKEATCKEEGVKVSTCALCKEKKTQKIEKLAHRYGAFKVVKEATCEETGEKVSECSLCKEKKTQVIERLSHKFSQPKVVKEPTCTEEGEKAGKCERCTKNTTEKIPATGHDFTALHNKCSRCEAVKEEGIPSVPEETTVPDEPTIPEETTVTEETTIPEETTVTEETTVPEGTTVTEETTVSEEGTVPVGAIVPEETQQMTEGTAPEKETTEETQPETTTGADTPIENGVAEEAVLKTIIIVASVLLLGVLVLLVVIVIRFRKKKE